ncbi:MAG: nucleotidyltransferase family protein [Acidobacteriota bacterium]|nr:nucleotidyltransferase family protein [Acidobacteriota bacterium]
MTRIAAVVLAAGSSSRMGSPKQLLRFGGITLLRRATLAAIDAGCDPVVVVTGAHAELSRQELEGLHVREAINRDWESGMASSIRSGIEAARDCDAAVLMLCDQPRVDAHVIAQLIAAFRENDAPIVASSYGGSFGVPALFSSVLFDELTQLHGAAGAKQIIAKQIADAKLIAFAGGETDVDTPEDFQRLLEHD